MSWWPPWRWKSDQLARDEVEEAGRRLDEAEKLRQRARRMERNMDGHKRRNRFGEMLDRDAYLGGDG